MDAESDGYLEGVVPSRGKEVYQSPHKHAAGMFME